MSVEGTIIQKDNFCDRIEEVRLSAMQSGFGTWQPNKGEIGSSKYEGMNFWGRHGLLLKELSKLLGGVPVFPNSMFFRVTKPGTERAYVHSDREAGSYTCIVYLSDHPEPEDPAKKSGTAFYRHRETGMTEMPSLLELSKRPDYEEIKKHIVDGSEKYWEQLSFIPGVFNRAIVFRAQLFHARLPIDGLGDGTDETARMVWACHFEM